MAEEYDYLFKSIVVGDGGVGKTALTLRFSKGFFTEDYKMTIGVDFHVKTINIDSIEGLIRAKLQIWDTGGQERFSSIRPMYYRGSLGALLIFDLTNAGSFEHLPQWIEEVRANVKTEIPLLLVGNKNDLVDQRTVSLEEINNFTRNFKLYYMETSAKTGEGVGDCFYILACLMIGSGVPDQLISRGIVFSPGQIPMMDTETYPTPAQKIKSEFDYAAPPVPEPSSIKAYEPTSTFEPEPEFEYEAPPVPEPAIGEKQEPTPIFEPEFQPEIPLPETKIEDSSKKPIQFDFKTPTEILSHEKPEQQYSPSQPTPFTSREETYKPKTIPFTDNIPVPAPPPEQFQSPQGDPSIQSFPSNLASNLAQIDSTDTKSDSLMDYLPEPIYSKKDKKKLDKQKKKEEKEKKLQEEKEKQERLLEEMKHLKKEKKEKTKKEKKEKVELKETKPPISAQPAPTTGTTSAPSLFQTLSQKVDDTEKTPAEAFVPFIADKESEAQEMSKLRIIPNVSDLESKPTMFSPTQTLAPAQPTVPKPSGKEIFICKQCGAILSSDYAFCNKCGSQL
ncbi:MAG: GTP-binding protein [Candidatus Lokiarchaeota archaeon]|nr:GTP-binding protein [Candidatus Lokiarchaeota archaeon]